MLLELAVRDLGVVAELRLVLGEGMTALTGETGAGKTLLVEAIDLLVGGRADPVLVRPGASEATVEGRFVVPAGVEVVLARVVPRDGRSRAYVNGRLATAAELAELGRSLVDLHGQHSHQSLLTTRAQREALDRFGEVDLAPLVEARARVAELDQALQAMGGDARARAREVDLLRFQVAELRDAAITGPEEDERLEAEEDALADAAAHRDAARAAQAALADDGGASDSVGQALSAIAGRRPFAELEERLRATAAELGELASDVRRVGEAIDDDPARLDEVRGRRRLLRELQRKYGETLGEVLTYASDAEHRLHELEDHDRRAATIEGEGDAARRRAAVAADAVLAARRAAAPGLAASVERHLHELALPRASFAVSIGDEPPGDDVAFLLAANTGQPPLPMAKVASGGELARTMLAVRLVLTAGPPTLVFDEVDAGIGGEAAGAVGRALAAVAADHQVLVVTHLPQVAAFADEQIAVAKREQQGQTVARADRVAGAARVVELSRMLSGRPESGTAREHAEELLAAASEERGR